MYYYTNAYIDLLILILNIEKLVENTFKVSRTYLELRHLLPTILMHLVKVALNSCIKMLMSKGSRKNEILMAGPLRGGGG